MTIENNQPAAGSIRWSNLNIQFMGVSYAVANGSTDKMYAYWTLATPNNLVVSDAFPTLTANDCIVFFNSGGMATVVPTATILAGGLIVPGSITAKQIDVEDLTAAILNIASVNAIDGEIDFVLSKNALAAYIMMSMETGITIGRNSGRFKNIIDDDGFVIYRDTKATTKVSDSGLEADAVKAGRFMIGDGATIEYSANDGFSILLL